MTHAGLINDNLLNRDHHNMANPKTRIMIIEDDEQFSAFMAKALEKFGYEPLVVHDSSRAIRAAELSMPQAFLIDLVMPPPDGFKLCRMLRGHRTFKQTPILIVTVLDNTDSKIVAIGAGANNYLVKPFSTDELVARVRELLRK